MMLGKYVSHSILVLIWSITVAPISLGMAAFIGAVAFLGLAQKMPKTSCAFMLELQDFCRNVVPYSVNYGYSAYGRADYAVKNHKRINSNLNTWMLPL